MTERFENFKEYPKMVYREKEKIPLFSGRPERNEIIGFNDLLNLKIALNHNRGWDDFLQRI